LSKLGAELHGSNNIITTWQKNKLTCTARSSFTHLLPGTRIYWLQLSYLKLGKVEDW